MASSGAGVGCVSFSKTDLPPLFRLPEEEQQHVGQIRATGRLRARVFSSCQPRTVEVAVEGGVVVVVVAVLVAVVKLPVEKNVKYQSRKSMT